MSSLSSLRARTACATAIAVAAICTTFATGAGAQDMNQISAQMHKVTEDAKAKQAQPGAKNYSIQSTSNIDGDLNTFVSTLNAGLACTSSKSAFQQQNSALIEKSKEVLGFGKQFQSNPLLRAAAAGPLGQLLQAALPVAKTFASACEHFSGATAASAKYEQVAAVMKQVFTGGDLSATSPAVKHAADVDMPARGGSPAALKTYLLSQNGSVKNWYKTNYGLR